MKADGDRYLEAAVKIEPKTTEDYYNIGCAYYYLEEQDEAVKAFSKAMKDSSSAAMEMLGEVYLSMVRTTRRKHCFLRIFRQMALHGGKQRAGALRKTTRTVHSRIEDSNGRGFRPGKSAVQQVYPMKNGRILIPRSR